MKYKYWKPLVLFSFSALLFTPCPKEKLTDPPSFTLLTPLYPSYPLEPVFPSAQIVKCPVPQPDLLPLYECLYKRKSLLHLLYDTYTVPNSRYLYFSIAMFIKYFDNLQDYYIFSLRSMDSLLLPLARTLIPSLPSSSILLDHNGRLSHAALLLLHPLLYNLDTSTPFTGLPYILTQDLYSSFIHLINALSAIPGEFFYNLLPILTSFYIPTKNIDPDPPKLFQLFRRRLSYPLRYFTDTLQFPLQSPMQSCTLTLTAPKQIDLAPTRTNGLLRVFDLNSVGLHNGAIVQFCFSVNVGSKYSHLKTVCSLS